MTVVERSQSYNVSAHEMWGRIGDFQGVHLWHPGIADCTPKENGEVRELALGDGAIVIERQVGETDRSYTYRILDPGPLPVAEYESTIAVRDGENGGSVVDWKATFAPSGAPEADASEVIAGVFEGGLGAL